MSFTVNHSIAYEVRPFCVREFSTPVQRRSFYLALLNVRVTVGNELYGRPEGARLDIFAFQSRLLKMGKSMTELCRYYCLEPLACLDL